LGNNRRTRRATRAQARRATAAAALIAAATAAAGTAAAEVTYDRLVNADREPENWLLPLQNYAGHRYSRLDQINRSNVRGLRSAFAVPVTTAYSDVKGPSLENHPLVDGGMMYLDDGWGRIYKIDVRSGKHGQILWTADGAVSKDERNRTRGMAIYGNAVYHNLNDGRVIAVDTTSGEFVFDRRVARIAHPKGAVFNVEREGFTGAPLAIDAGLLVGQSSGDDATRGWLALIDRMTGEERWRTYTIPGPGEPGHETWADGHNAWKTGGGGLWTVGTYDAALRLTIWGTGNAMPMFDPEYRPGDNLYTVSAVAFDVDTGAISWHFQYIPNESWDFDEQGVHMLVPGLVDGEQRQQVVHFGRNGFYYHLDRATGAFIGATQYVEALNWTSGLDPKTGKPLEYDRALKLQTYRPETRWSRGDAMEVVCPSSSGGVRWQPPAYNPARRVAYAAGHDGCGARQIFPGGVLPLTPQGGLDPATPGGMTAALRSAAINSRGVITAIDVDTRRVRAQVSEAYENLSGVLATAGGLIFTGRRDGSVAAYHDETLEELWSWNGGIAFKAPPISYAVGGTQYIAIIAGASGPVPLKMNEGAMLWVFSL
jgi:alcohol dehydrogenase (cytochrome c)